MSDEQPGIYVPFEKLFGDLSTSLKEGFDKLDRRMDKFEQQLALKADNTRVAELAKQMNDHELRVDQRFKPLESASIGSAAVTTFQRWMFGTVGVGVLGAIATLVWLASGGH